jgi:F-type H+-transporting ATPase subunit b
MLTIDIPTILFQIFNFLVLAVALYFLLFRSVVRNVRERARKKEQLIQDVEKTKADTEKTLVAYQQKLADVDKEIDQIIKKAEQTVEDERKQAISDIELEANRILGEAQAEVENREKISLEQFYDQVVDQIMSVSQSVISKTVTVEIHNQLIQQMADEIWRMGREDLQRVASIRNSLRERIPIVHVDTAMPLTADQQGLLVRTFSALADRTIKTEIHEDKGLGAGCHVRIGDLVVDNTTTAQVQKLRDSATAELRKKLEM